MANTLTIVGIEHIAPDDMYVLDAVMRRMHRSYPKSVLNVFPRNDRGFLEWILQYQDGNGNHQMTVGIVQRRVHQEVEFHS